MNGRAREERGQGQPLDDVSRACRHYNITEEEYCAHPEQYPLPERGAGLTSGSSVMTGALIVGAVIILGLGISRALVTKENIVPIKRIGTAMEPGSEKWLKEVAKGQFRVTSTHKWQAEAETAYMELKAKGLKPSLYAVTDTWTTYYVTTPMR